MIKYNIIDSPIKKLNQIQLDKHMKKILNTVGIEIMKGLDKNIKQKKDSSGTAWKPLAQSTLKQRKNKDKSTAKILENTGQGKRMDMDIGTESVKVGTTKEYFGYHNSGTERLPRREWAFVTKDTEKKINLALKKLVEKIIKE